MGKGKILGYIRVSSTSQNPDRQLEGVYSDKLFTDTVSGSTTNRPALDALKDYAREGDEIIIHSMDRLARNFLDLKQLVNFLTAQDITVRFIKEGLSFNGHKDPISELMLTLLGGIAEFERSIIRERQAEGIALAKKRGVYKGRKKLLSIEQVEGIKNNIALGVPKARIARSLNISRATLYQYIGAS